MWLSPGNQTYLSNTIDKAMGFYYRGTSPKGVAKPRWIACVNQLFNNHGVKVNWKQHQEALQAGSKVSFRPKGNSMKPKIKSGQLVTVEPSNEYFKGDIVFCKVKGSYYVHLLSATKKDQYQISNNKGRVNGWISKSNIFGKVTSVED